VAERQGRGLARGERAAAATEDAALHLARRDAVVVHQLAGRAAVLADARGRAVLAGAGVLADDAAGVAAELVDHADARTALHGVRLDEDLVRDEAALRDALGLAGIADAGSRATREH